MNLRYFFRDEPACCPACRRSVSAVRRSDEAQTRVSRHLFQEAAPNQDGHHTLDAGGFCPGSMEIAPALEARRAR